MDALLNARELELLDALDYSEDRALALNTALREQGLAPDRAAAVLTQARLRAEAARKLGPDAAALLYTRAGMEQATRAAVAARHAERFVAAGIASVADLGCGLGADARALARAGLDVLAVEIDPETAAAATHNLSPFEHARVLEADATALAPERLTDSTGRPVQALWLDPARRETGGSRRIFDPEAFSPPFSEIRRLAATGIPMGVKMGPGMDHDAIPAEAEAEWVGHGGDVVELVLWFNALRRPGVRRAATLLSPDVADPAVLAELTAGTEFGADAPAPEETNPPGAYLYEPHGAVIRAELVGELARAVDGRLIDPRIAYVTAEQTVDLPWATCWRVLDRLPLHPKALKKWARERGLASVNIKKRGVDVVPETLRKQMLAGSGKSAGKKGSGTHADLILTRWEDADGEHRAAFHVEPAAR